jgi:hypothetical protein
MTTKTLRWLAVLGVLAGSAAHATQDDGHRQKLIARHVVKQAGPLIRTRLANVHALLKASQERPSSLSQEQQDAHVHLLSGVHTEMSIANATLKTLLSMRTAGQLSPKGEAEITLLETELNALGDGIKAEDQRARNWGRLKSMAEGAIRSNRADKAQRYTLTGELTAAGETYVYGEIPHSEIVGYLRANGHLK